MDVLHEGLGASPPTGNVQDTLFIPSVDRDDQPVDQAYWIEQALEELAMLFRGATAFPSDAAPGVTTSATA
ncbi:MAG TPA: hypothetical protein VMD59_21660 [Acidimicrobiales bacterium]|nr:hypothetical protein [Acidimicrobiales bacterium]